MRRALRLLALVSVMASALGYADCVAGKEANFTATNLVNLRGTPLVSGSIVITPTDQLGNAIPFRSGTGKAVGKNPITLTVTSGSMVGELCIPRSDAASVAVRYHIVVKDNSVYGTNSTIIDAPKVAITGDSFELHDYDFPATTAPIQTNPFTSGTVNGDLHVTGTIFGTIHNTVDEALHSGSAAELDEDTVIAATQIPSSITSDTSGTAAYAITLAAGTDRTKLDNAASLATAAMPKAGGDFTGPVTATLFGGAYYAKQYQTGGGGNGISNLQASAACTSGCVIFADKTYASEEPKVPTVSGVTLYDFRQGFGIYTLNPGGSAPYQPAVNTATATAQPLRARFNSWQPATAGRSTEIFWTGPGKNIGNPGGGNPNSGWVNDSAFPSWLYAERRGIHQGHTSTFNCWAQGDCGFNYLYLNASGGTPDASGEGIMAHYARVAEENAYWTGVLASTTGTGDTAPVMTATGIQHFTDGSYLLRTQAESNHADVVSSTSSNGYIDITISNGTFPTSTAWGRLTDGVAKNQINAQTYLSNSNINVTLGLPSATSSPSDFHTGLACMVDQTIDWINITAAPASVAGVQKLDFESRYGWRAGAVMMQGAPCGEAYTVNTTWKTPLMIVGATSPTHLIASECSHGDCSRLYGTTPGAPIYFSPGAAATVTRSDGANVVVSLNVASGTHIHDFSVGMTITLSGFTPADFNGTCTVSANTQDVYNASLTCPLAGANATASVVGTLTQPMTHITAYYAAEVIGTTDGTATKPQLAYNAIPFATGDAFEDPHTNAMFPAVVHYLAFQYSPYDNSAATNGTRYLYEVGGTVPPPVGVGYINSTGLPLPRAWAYFNGPANNGIEFSYAPSYNGALLKADAYFNSANIRTHLICMPETCVDWLQGTLLANDVSFTNLTATNAYITNATIANTTFSSTLKAPNSGYCFTNSTNTCFGFNPGLNAAEITVAGSLLFRVRTGSNQISLPTNIVPITNAEWLVNQGWTMIAQGVATSSNNYGSWGSGWRSSIWTGSAAIPDDWSINPVIGAGVNPTSTLLFNHWRGSTGRASASFPIVDIGSSSTWAGLHIAGGASDPSTLTAGDIWYSTTSDHLKFRDSSAARTLMLTSDAVTAAQMPAFTGDVTSSAGATALTLATVNSNVGSFGSATEVPGFTVNGKGLITAVSTHTVPVAFGVSVVTTAAASDDIGFTGMAATWYCAAPNPLDSTTAAAGPAYISAKATGSLTLTHPATAGLSYEIVCTPNNAAP